MTLATRLFASKGHLPPALTRDVMVERGLRVKMPDGIELLADHYYARHGGEDSPIILIRSPYGRNSIWGLTCRLVAERGFQAIVQSVRGTFGSGGEFDPEINEARDGIATMEWLKEQEWFSGGVALMGPSYLGYAQWAIATNFQPEYLKAIVPTITASEFRSVAFPGGSYALDSNLTWAYLIRKQEKMGKIQGVISQFRMNSILKPAFEHVPLKDADELVLGEKDRIYQDSLANEMPGKFWDNRDLSARVKDVAVPVHLIGGWYDIFLPYQLEDYFALKASGKVTPYLTIGPWTHTSTGGIFEQLRESLAWCDNYLRGDGSKLRKDPVKVYVMGQKQWLTFPGWPPPQMRPVPWYLQENRVLEQKLPSKDSPFDSYDYDPKDPTPSVGGVVLGMHGGPKDNRKLEQRADVLTYTTTPLDQDYTIIGPLSVELYVQSSLENTDFFARLCDVSPNGKSINISDSLIRLWPNDFQKYRGADGIARITFDLWPTACSFLKTHRIRLQISSGSHPRFARNLGSGEPLTTAKDFVTANQKIFHDAAHPSHILVPFISKESS